MKDRAAALLPLLALVALAALTFWLDSVVRTDAQVRPTRHDPDYFVDQLRMQRFDAGGQLQHTITARHMVHFPDDDTTEASEPRLVYHRTPLTEITAQRAWIGRDGKEVILSDDVRVTRASASGGPPTVITTSRLRVLPDDEVAHSDAPVTIAQGASRVSGSGLDIDNRRHLSVLHGRVSGIFHRQPSKTP